MSINVKAVERKLAFDKKNEKWAYVLKPELYSQLSQAKVIQEAALRSGISKGVINAAWNAIGDVVKTWATEGHSVAIPGLGSMRFGLRSVSVDDVSKVSTSLITTRKVLFTPSVEIKEELANTSINITCFDRTGKQVSKVTSKDEGDVEDDEDDKAQSGSDTETGKTDTTGGTTPSTGDDSTSTEEGSSSSDE